MPPARKETQGTVNKRRLDSRGCHRRNPNYAQKQPAPEKGTHSGGHKLSKGEAAMKRVGVWLMVFGFGSMVLNFFGMEFKILMWVDNWGEMVGWGIRGAVAVTGVVLFVLGMREQTQAAPAGKAKHA